MTVEVIHIASGDVRYGTKKDLNPAIPALMSVSHSVRSNFLGPRRP